MKFLGYVEAHFYCPCGRAAALVGGDVVYPHREDLREKLFWKCSWCGSYVGCHPSTPIPLGSLADEETRRLRSTVHSVFDKLWKDGGMKRKEAYKLLREELGITKDVCHIALFTADECRAAVNAVANINAKLNA